MEDINPLDALEAPFGLPAFSQALFSEFTTESGPFVCFTRARGAGDCSSHSRTFTKWLCFHWKESRDRYP